MGIGLPIKRQHVVEFIRGTGVKIDGVTYSNYNGGGVNGPWTWNVPADVYNLLVDIVSGGSGGGGGWNTGTSLAGGGGGGSGICLQNAKIPVSPSSTLTITVGTGGTGGAAGSAGNNGSLSKISGIPVHGYVKDTTTTDLVMYLNYNGGGNPGTSGASGQGGIVNNIAAGYGASATNSASPPNGGDSEGLTTIYDNQTYRVSPFGGHLSGAAGSGGGAASTSGSTAGGNGGFHTAGGHLTNTVFGASASLRGAGNTTGTISRAGGGVGGYCMLGRGGAGGAGGANGGDAIGYGAGGGGGGGGAAGGNGSDGYVKFIYSSFY